MYYMFLVLLLSVFRNCYWCCVLRIFVGVVKNLSIRLRRGNICSCREYDVRMGDNWRNYTRISERIGDLIRDRMGEDGLYRLIF